MSTRSSETATWINFHGIGSVTREFEPGEEPYWITKELFADCLDQITRQPGKNVIRISFDDGNMSDLEIALPLLKERGLTAIFFILAARLERSGFLSAENLRELVSQGMTIGSHGWDHRDLRSLNDELLEEETITSKAVLEDVVGQPVTDFSVPFGLYDKRVITHINKAGYHRIYTSDRGFARGRATILRRNSIRSDDVMGSFSKWVNGDHGMVSQCLDDLRCFVKRNR